MVVFVVMERREHGYIGILLFKNLIYNKKKRVKGILPPYAECQIQPLGPFRASSVLCPGPPLRCTCSPVWFPPSESRKLRVTWMPGGQSAGADEAEGCPGQDLGGLTVALPRSWN